MVSVAYIDQAGAAQTLTETTDWRLVDGNLLLPAFGRSWPNARCDHETVTLQWDTGYGTALNEPAVPEPIRTAILLNVATWYANREEIVVGDQVAALPGHAGAEQLLSTFRIYSV